MFSAKVKNIISGDTLVLIPLKTNQFPPPERILSLNYVRAEDYASKSYLRELLIGRDIKFKVNYKNPTTNKEFGDIQAPIFKSLIAYLLEKGWVKLKDNFSESEGDIYYELKDIEDTARRNQLGLWSTQSHINIVDLDDKIILKSQKYPLKVIVEKVISGDRVLARIVLNDSDHVTTPILLGGFKTPRTDDSSQSSLETKVALQAKNFVEEKLLTTKAELTVSIIGESQTGVPIGLINHPSGNNIHEKLLEQGFAEIVDWQSTLVGSTLMATFRKAELSAKALAKGLYANTTQSKSVSSISSSMKLRPGLTIENVQIVKVVNVDTFLVRLPSNEEVTVQLASVRGPRPNDSTAGNQQLQAALVATAKEFVREKAIGKSASLYVEGFREPNESLNLDGRFLVSFKLNQKDLSELIISNGWATVLRHSKATSHERSINWDKLLEIEEEAKKNGKKGLFASDIQKVLTVGTRIIDTSENLTKSKTFLNGFKQKGRISGYYVEYISSGTRLKLFNPKEGLKLTLILAGLANSKDSQEALGFLNKKYLQRSVEFEIFDTDKVGNFIGNVYSNANAISPIQTQLLELGFVKLHDISVHSNPNANELIKSEELAKSSKKGIWANYDEASERELNERLSQASIKDKQIEPKIFEGEVVDISKGIISFHYNDEATISKFQNFKNQFNQFHLQRVSASSQSIDLPFQLNKPPKKGELLSGKFDENGKYYRVKVIGYDKTTGLYTVKHIDFGNEDEVPLNSLRILPAKFGISTYPVFAHSTILLNVKLPPTKEYLEEAGYALEDLLFDKKLVFETYPGKETEYESVIYDSNKVSDLGHSINRDLVEEGWGIVEERKELEQKKKDYTHQLKAAQNNAKSKHLGCWEFGDVSFEEELLI